MRPTGNVWLTRAFDWLILLAFAVTIMTLVVRAQAQFRQEQMQSVDTRAN